jgi:hypothetical protein
VGKIIKNNWVILLILFTSVLVRVSRLPQLFVFGLDEEYQANLAWWLVKDFKAIWIGVSAANTGFYLGPGFTYLNYLIFLIFKGDPIFLGYFSVILSLLTLASLFYITQNLINKKTAIVAILLYGFSSLVIFSDLRFWNPSPIPFISIWVIYSLIKSFKNTKWLMLSSVLLALSLHVHLSLLVYWPIFIFCIFKNIKKISLSTWIFGIIGYFLIISPLIVFDFNHNFDNLKTPLRLISGLGSSTSGGSHIQGLLTAVTNLFYQGNNSILKIIIFLLLTFSIFLFSKRIEQTKSIFLTTLCLFLGSFLIYPGIVHDYYLLGLYPLVCITVAVTLEKINWKVTAIILIVYIATNLSNFFSIPTNSGLATKKSLVTQVSKNINQDFYLATSGDYRNDGGWRYLFQTYGKKPTQSDADNMFGWIYPEEISKTNPKIRVVISEAEIVKFQKYPKFHSGIYYAYIVPND